MEAFVFSIANFSFNVCFIITLVLLLIEMVNVALGEDYLGIVSSFKQPDPDIHAGLVLPGLPAFSSWIYLSHLPLVLWLVVFMPLFGVVGYLLNLLTVVYTHFPASLIISSALSMTIASIMMHFIGQHLSQKIPRDLERTDVLNPNLGATAQVIVGNAQVGIPTRARFIDEMAQEQFVLVEPLTDDDQFDAGDEVILVQRLATRWLATRQSPQLYPD